MALQDVQVLALQDVPFHIAKFHVKSLIFLNKKSLYPKLLDQVHEYEYAEYVN